MDERDYKAMNEELNPPLQQCTVSGSVCDGCKFDTKCNLQDQGFFKEICRYFEQTDR